MDEDTSYVSLSLNKYNELYDKARKYDERFKLTDETGYVLISEIIKAHVAEHSNDTDPKARGNLMMRCEQALQILDMLKEND